MSERLALHLGDKPVHTADGILIGALDLTLGAERFERIDTAKPLYSLPLIFEQHMMNQKRLGALLMTEHGDANEEIVGIITTFDLPMITESTFTQ